MTVCVTVPTLLQFAMQKLVVKFVVATRSVSIHLSQPVSMEIDINKAVSDSLKDIIIDLINKIRNIKKDLIKKQFFSFITNNSATNYEQEFIGSALNYKVRHNIITNRPNSNDDSYFVNSEIKLMDDK